MGIVLYGGMKHNQRQYNRRSTRLRNHDYAQPGAYFVTIVTQDRASLFGTIENGQMLLNDAGKMVLKWYFELERKFPCVKCDVVVCMPDHIHLLIFIVDDSSECWPTESLAHVTNDDIDHRDLHLGDHAASPIRPSRPNLGDIIGWFKTMTTNEYIRGVRQSKWPAFNRRLWQRNYHDHKVRTAEALANIRQYIDDNPRRGDPTWS